MEARTSNSQNRWPMYPHISSSSDLRLAVSCITPHPTARSPVQQRVRRVSLCQPALRTVLLNSRSVRQRCAALSRSVRWNKMLGFFATQAWFQTFTAESNKMPASRGSKTFVGMTPSNRLPMKAPKSDPTTMKATKRHSMRMTEKLWSRL